MPRHFPPDEEARYCAAVTAAEPNLIGEKRVTVGRVTALDDGSVTIEIPRGNATQHLSTTADTVVVKASAGAASDIAPGVRVVLKYRPGTQNQKVDELVVLGADSLHGVPVLEMSTNSITIRNLAGTSLVLDTEGASIDKTSSASLSDVAVGSMIFVRARLLSEGELGADEIIVLPVDTVFGSG
jgi:hypothetical protein